jgi:Trk K+ transport system NAD-binding subunit
MHPGIPSPASPDRHRRIIVVGHDELACYLIESLAIRDDLEVVAVIPEGIGAAGDRIRKLANPHTKVLRYRHHLRPVDAVLEAGFTEAYAVALMQKDDIGNLQAALELRDHAESEGEMRVPRLAIRLKDYAMGADIMDLMGDENVVMASETQLAARTFTAAALLEEPPGVIHIWGQRLSVQRNASHRHQATWVIANDHDSRVELLGSGQGSATRYLCLEADARQLLPWLRRHLYPTWAMQSFHRTRRALHVLRHLFNRALWIGAACLFAILAAGFWILDRYPSSAAPVSDGWDALYVLTLIAGGGTDPDMGAHQWVKVTHSVVVLAGSLFVPVVTGAIVQAVIDRRYAIGNGRMVRAVRDHVIVVGLDALGIEVVEGIRKRRNPVVAIERDPRAPGVRLARALGAQVLLGDASDPEILAEAEIRHAHTMVITAPNAIESLKIQLAAKRQHPHLHTVLRLAEPGFAAKVRQRLLDREGEAGMRRLGSYSVSRIGAEFFASRLLGDTVVDFIPVRDDLIYLCQFEVAEGSSLDDAPMADADEDGSHRLVAIRMPSGTVRWNLDRTERLTPGDVLLILATRIGVEVMAQRTSTRYTE